MDPPQQPSTPFYNHINERLLQYLDKFDQLPPICFVDFTDDCDLSDARLGSLYQRTDRKQTRSNKCALLVAYFLLGRALSTFGSRDALRRLRRWTTPERAKHVYRTAYRTHELFTIKGPEYLYVSSLSHTVLREMSAATYATLLGFVQAQATQVRLVEQTPSEGDNVTAHETATALRP